MHAAEIPIFARSTIAQTPKLSLFRNQKGLYTRSIGILLDFPGCTTSTYHSKRPSEHSGGHEVRPDITRDVNYPRAPQLSFLIG